MVKRGLNKVFWGFIFIMFGINISGFDILPDVVGYLLFIFGFLNLKSRSTYFNTAAKYNIPMIILSIISIYEKPAPGNGLQLGSLGIWGVLLMIASFILNLLVVYNMFMGIKDIADKQGQYDLSIEACGRWRHYYMVQIGILVSFIFALIPPLAIIFLSVVLIVPIILAITILRFLRRCMAVLD